MCEKCRLMELFDEELARFETYDNGKVFSIARHRYALERHGISEGRAMVIAHGEPFQVQPDPLAEWKALEPGRRVLQKNIRKLYVIAGVYHDYILFTDKTARSYSCLSEEFQIIHEGPFDARKLQYGDWLWDEHYRQWVQFKEIASDGLIGIIGRGINYYVNPYNPNLYFTPPSREERIERATEKIWHLIDRAANQSTVAKEEAHAILTELVGGKP